MTALGSIHGRGISPEDGPRRGRGLGLRARTRRERARGAMTLVELLIVVLILGILAAIVLPQFTNATGDAKLSAMVRDLELIRKQVQLYRHEHNGNYPPLTEFETQMTSRTNPDGSTSGTPRFGPYLMSIPVNPFTLTDSIGSGSVGSSAWYYNATTGEFRANCHEAHTVY